MAMYHGASCKAVKTKTPNNSKLERFVEETVKQQRTGRRLGQEPGMNQVYRLPLKDCLNNSDHGYGMVWPFFTKVQDCGSFTASSRSMFLFFPFPLAVRETRSRTRYPRDAHNAQSCLKRAGRRFGEEGPDSAKGGSYNHVSYIGLRCHLIRLTWAQFFMFRDRHLAAQPQQKVKFPQLLATSVRHVGGNNYKKSPLQNTFLSTNLPKVDSAAPKIKAYYPKTPIVSRTPTWPQDR